MLHFVGSAFHAIVALIVYAFVIAYLSVGALYAYFELHFGLRQLAKVHGAGFFKWLKFDWLTASIGKLAALSVFLVSTFLVLQVVRLHSTSLFIAVPFWFLIAVLLVVATIHLVHITQAIRVGLKAAWAAVKQDAHRA